MQQIATRAFYSIQDSKMPARSAIVAVFVNITLNLTLVWFIGTAGLALSTAICSYLQVVILLFVLRQRFGNSILEGLVTTLVKTLVASAFMYLVGHGLLGLLKNLPSDRASNVLRLAAVVPLAAGVYLLAAKLLRIETLSLITGKKRASNLPDKV